MTALPGSIGSQLVQAPIPQLPVLLPGPAGRLQALAAAGQLHSVTPEALGLPSHPCGSSSGTTGPGGSGLGAGAPPAEGVLAASSAWRAACNCVAALPGGPVQLSTVREARQLGTGKLPRLQVLLLDWAPGLGGDAFARAADASGTLGAAVAGGVAAAHPGVGRGAALLLRNVSVLTPASGLTYLCITAANVDQVFPAAPSPGSSHHDGPLQQRAAPLAPPTGTGGPAAASWPPVSGPSQPAAGGWTHQHPPGGRTQPPAAGAAGGRPGAAGGLHSNTYPDQQQQQGRPSTPLVPPAAAFGGGGTPSAAAASNSTASCLPPPSPGVDQVLRGVRGGSTSAPGPLHPPHLRNSSSTSGSFQALQPQGGEEEGCVLLPPAVGRGVAGGDGARPPWGSNSGMGPPTCTIRRSNLDLDEDLDLPDLAWLDGGGADAADTQPQQQQQQGRSQQPPPAGAPPAPALGMGSQQQHQQQQQQQQQQSQQQEGGSYSAGGAPRPFKVPALPQRAPPAAAAAAGLGGPPDRGGPMTAAAPNTTSTTPGSAAPPAAAPPAPAAAGVGAASSRPRPRFRQATPSSQATTCQTQHQQQHAVGSQGGRTQQQQQQQHQHQQHQQHCPGVPPAAATISSASQGMVEGIPTAFLVPYWEQQEAAGGLPGLGHHQQQQQQEGDRLGAGLGAVGQAQPPGGQAQAAGAAAGLVGGVPGPSESVAAAAAVFGPALLNWRGSGTGGADSGAGAPSRQQAAAGVDAVAAVFGSQLPQGPPAAAAPPPAAGTVVEPGKRHHHASSEQPVAGAGMGFSDQLGSSEKRFKAANSAPLAAAAAAAAAAAPAPAAVPAPGGAGMGMGWGGDDGDLEAEVAALDVDMW